MDYEPFCIYCAGLRRDTRLTLEHIWPQALGGAFAPDLFKSRWVCSRCNSLAGLWVDGAFLKSWFISHELSNSGRTYLDPSEPGIAPPMYMGVDQQFPVHDGDVAELWMGAGGDSIHHVHLADDEKWYGFAGGDLIRRKVDLGRAYLMLRSESQYWAAVSLKSFDAFVPGARHFSATELIGARGPVIDRLIPEAEATPKETAELAWIRGVPAGTPHKASFSHRLDFSQRFLAKLALGVGSNLFSADYCRSPYADELRRALWPSYPNAGSELSIYGTDLLRHTALDGSRLSGLPGTWSLCLIAVNEGFGLSITTPGGRNMVVMITNEPRKWTGPDLRAYGLGQFYFVVPERQIFAGPISTLDFINHQNRRRPHPTLAHIESLQSDPSTLPPLR